MKMLKIIAVSATLLAGVSAAYANPFDVMSGQFSLNSIDEARYATVIKVSDGAASYLAFDNDVASVQARIKNNPFLARTLADQGFSIDQVVGIEGSQTDLTIYAL
jgi:hypothetical protein